MTTFRDVPTEDLLEALASELDGRISAPEWAEFAKSSAGKELSPEQEDFWPRRAASLLRTVAVDGPVGIERLSTAYGSLSDGSNRYRVRPGHRRDGSKKIIRTILQQLEAESLVETAEGEGRVIAPAGLQLLDETAESVMADLDRPELERYA